jgi:hypothetical protein
MDHDVKTLTFFSAKDLAASIREAKEAHRAVPMDSPDYMKFDEDFVAAYLFEHQGAEVKVDAPSHSSDNLPADLEAALRTVQKYATITAVDGSGPIFTL